MPSKIEINVALNGRHFFVASVNCETQVTQRVKNAIKEITDRFPETEGYTVTVTHWECSGKHIDV